MSTATLDAGPFCWHFIPSVTSDARLIYLNATLVADPSGFVEDALARLQGSSSNVASSFMYAGSTPQDNGRRSAYVGPMGDGRAAVIGTVRMRSGVLWQLHAKGIRTPLTELGKDGMVDLLEFIEFGLASLVPEPSVFIEVSPCAPT